MGNMNRDHVQYLLVEGEPFLSACEDWRKRWIAARTEMSKFAHEFGSNGLFVGFNGRLYGLTPVNPLPVGWKLSGRSGQRQFMEPHKSAAGLRARMAELPGDPSHDELLKLVGCPADVRWTTPDGGWGVYAVGFCRIHSVELIWGEGTPMVLIAPDSTKTVAGIREEHPDATITEGEGWVPPAGLRRISEAQWRLICAQAEVAREEAKKEAA